MPDVMILVFRKRIICCFQSQKRCALANFKDNKRVTFHLAGKERWKNSLLILTVKTCRTCHSYVICKAKMADLNVTHVCQVPSAPRFEGNKRVLQSRMQMVVASHFQNDDYILQGFLRVLLSCLFAIKRCLPLKRMHVASFLQNEQYSHVYFICLFI